MRVGLYTGFEARYCFPQKGKIPLSDDFEYWCALAVVRQAERLHYEVEKARQPGTDIAAERPNAGLYQCERELRTGDLAAPQSGSPSEVLVVNC